MMTDVERHHLEGNAALLCEEGSPRAVTRVGIHRLGGKGYVVACDVEEVAISYVVHHGP